MLKRIVNWGRYYWPSLLLVAELALAYWLLLLFVFQVAWPMWYSNGEPLSVTLNSTQLMRTQQKLAYIQNCYNTYVRLGLLALGLYGVYALSGRLAMPHQAHVRFGKGCRSAFINAFFVTMLAEFANLFAIHVNISISGFVIKVLTILSCGVSVFNAFLQMGYVYSHNRRKAKLRGLLISFGVLVIPIAFLWLLQGLSSVISLGWYLLNWITQQKDAVITTVPNHYMLTIPIDFLLPTVMFVLLGFLYIAMKYAGPVASSTPLGGRAYAQISDKTRLSQEAA